MKKIIFVLIALLGMGTTPALLAQNVTQDFESGNEKGQKALCWYFKDFDFEDGSIVITGEYSGESKKLDDDNKWRYVRSPWMTVSPGNLTFKCKLSEDDWENALMKVELEDYPDETVTEIYNYAFTPPGTSVIDVTVPVSVSGIYRIYISFKGDDGDAKAIIDDIVYPGIYNSDPPECDPLNPITDTDGDGVPDSEDDYPTDQYRAYNNYLPSSGSYSTVMFEDLWPAIGDYDFNDMVVDYQLNRVTNAQNNVVEVLGNFKVRASGASFHNGFGFQFDGLPNNKIISVTGSDLMSPSVITLNGAGLEDGQTYATVIVFDDIYNVMGYPGGGTGINVIEGAPYVDPITITITMTMISDGTPASGGFSTLNNVSLALFNPFIFVNQERGKEVHLPDMPPTALVDDSYFNTDQDDSNPATGRYYKTEDNLPWGLQIVESIPYMKEKDDITGGYLHLESWANSDGVSYPDWYEDKSGYRNNSTIYQAPVK